MSTADASMSFVDHLVDLRRYLVRAVAGVVLGTMVAYFFYEELYAFFTAPVRQALAERGVYRLVAIGVFETFANYLKATLMGSLCVTAPFALYQLWCFVAPGLLPEERRFVAPVAAFSALFFLLGGAFAYTVMLPFMTGFMTDISLAGGNVDVQITVANAFSFSLTFLIMFGLIFELPIAMFFLTLFEVADWRAFKKGFRFFVVIAFVVGAILTPPDPLSQFMLAIPMIALYGLGLAISWLVGMRPVDGETGTRQAVGMGLWLKVSGALAGMAAGLAAVVFALRPAPELHERVPSAAAWAVGASVHHLPVDFVWEGLAHALGATELAEPLRQADSAQFILIEVAGGARAALLLGARGDLELAEQAANAAGIHVQDFGSAGMALGKAIAVEAFAACINDGDACISADAEHSLTLAKRAGEGPLWAVATRDASDWTALLPSPPNAPPVERIEAALSVGNAPTLLLRVHTGGNAHAAALRAHLAAWRSDQSAKKLAQGASGEAVAQLARAFDDIATASELALKVAAASRPSSADRSQEDAALSQLQKTRASLAALTQGAGNGDEPSLPTLWDRIEPAGLRGWEAFQEGSQVLLRFDISPGALRPLVLPR